MIRALVLAVFLVAGTAVAQDVRRISILHSNDLHARLLPDDSGFGGWAQLATLVRRERAGCDHCTYVHAGDLVQGTPVSTMFRGTPLYEIANRFGFDMASLGNHEFDYGYQQVPQFLKAARFPIATANVVNEEGMLIARRAYVLKKVNGIRVAFIGAVMGDLVEGYTTPLLMGPWKALPVVETVNRYVDELKSKADLFVVVGHIQQREGSDLLRRAPGVSVVIEGHTHRGRSELEIHENRVVAGCRAYGVELCRLDLEFDRKQRKLVSWDWKRIPVKSSEISPAPDMKRLIDYWENRVAKEVDVEIANTSRDWNQADLVGLIEQAMREEMSADFAYMNRGGVRDQLVKGTVLARHVWNIMPFDNRMVIAKVPGSRVPERLRGGQTLEPDRVYIITMSDFTALNQAERERVGHGDIQFERTDRLLRDLLIDWMRKKKTF